MSFFPFKFSSQSKKHEPSEESRGDGRRPVSRSRDYVVDRKVALLQRCAESYRARFPDDAGNDRLVSASEACARAVETLRAQAEGEGQSVASAGLRGALEELLSALFSCLENQGSSEWLPRSEQKLYARKFSRDHDDWEAWSSFFETRPADTLVNLMIVAAQQAHYLLDKAIARREMADRRFRKVRAGASDGEWWSRPLARMLGEAESADDLAVRVAAVKAKVDELADALGRDKWGVQP